MLDLIFQSGPLFLGLITIIFFLILIVAYINGMPILKHTNENIEALRTRINYTKSLGLLALVIGVAGQLIGLYSAFGAIANVKGEISPQILIGGLKVSLIPTLYGLIVFIISYLIWLGLSWKLRRD